MDNSYHVWECCFISILKVIAPAPPTPPTISYRDIISEFCREQTIDIKNQYSANCQCYYLPETLYNTFEIMKAGCHIRVKSLNFMVLKYLTIHGKNMKHVQ